MAAGRWTAFTVDGPRGPRRVAQPGAVWLARSSGHAILPFHVEADRCWTIGSWDRTQIPKPFANITLCLAKPMTVAADEDVGAALARLQAPSRRSRRAPSPPPDFPCRRCRGDTRPREGALLDRALTADGDG